MKTANEAFQALEDLGGSPKVRVQNYAAIWDGDLGFIWHVEADKAEEFARRLREMADCIEGTAPQPRYHIRWRDALGRWMAI